MVVVGVVLYMFVVFLCVFFVDGVIDLNDGRIFLNFVFFYFLDVLLLFFIEKFFLGFVLFC